MSEAFIFWGVILLVITGFLMLFRPFRAFIVSVFGAKSVWGLIWALIAEVFVAHWNIIRNFAPRGVIFPTLDTRKRTNAEDD